MSDSEGTDTSELATIIDRGAGLGELPDTTESSVAGLSGHQTSTEINQPTVRPKSANAFSSIVLDSVKKRSTRRLTPQAKTNRINDLRGRICKLTTRKLAHYESFFNATERTDIDSLEQQLNYLDTDAVEINNLCDELNKLLDNKSDEIINRVLVDYHKERKENIALINMQLDELERIEAEMATAAAAQAEEEMRQQIKEIEERRRNQAEARRLFQQKQLRLTANSMVPPTGESSTTQSTSSTTSGLNTEHKQSIKQPASTLARTYRVHNQHTTLQSAPEMRHMRSPQSMDEDQDSSHAQIERQPTMYIAEKSYQPNDDKRSVYSDTEKELSAVEQLATTITACMKETKRTIIEPSIFTGDILQFNDWESDFDDFLDAEGIKGVRQLRMLKKYVDEDAKKCIAGFFMDDTVEAYNNARKYLKDRYGKKTNVARKFKKTLMEWPKLRPKDGYGLQELADFLVHCSGAMKSVPQLSSLNHPDENYAITAKLPEWLQNKWKYQVANHEDNHDGFPSFDVFTQFVMREAKAMNIFSDYEQWTDGASENKKAQHRGYSKKINSYRTASSPDKECLYCESTNHHTSTCRKLANMSYDDTMKWVNDERLCYSCVEKGHSARICNNKRKCEKCYKLHPTILHKTKKDWDKAKAANTPTNVSSAEDGDPVKTPPPSEEIKPQIILSNNIKSHSNILSMVSPVYVSTTGDKSKEILVYALLDTQSDSCFISREIASQLKPSYSTERVSISTMIGTKEENIKLYRNIQIRSYSNNKTLNLQAYESEKIPCEKHHIPNTENTKDLPYLEQIKDQIPPPLDAPIGLLLGMSCSDALAVTDHIQGPKGQPFAVKTMLGWTVCGIKRPQHDLRILKTDINKDKQILQLLELDFKDMDGEKMSQEDFKFLEILDKETRRDKDGSYVLPLPFKKEVSLPQNRQQAEKRLNSLLKKFKTDVNYKTEYHNSMTKLINNGYAEEAPTSQTPQAWYIPHFGVTHPKKKKLRVVFDASAKQNGVSLNDTLLQGPDSMNSLIGILIRFRKEKVAICCDIESMFHNFHVPEHHRDYLRFLWINIEGNTKEYRMTRHLFGAISSPAVATYGLRRLAKDYITTSKKAADFLCNDFYVDDGLISTPTAQEAIQLITQTTEICSKGNIRLHKFISNDREVMALIPPTERSESTQSINLDHDQLPSERTLGLQWNVDSDNFQFKISIEQRPTTKRGLLSMVSQVFDPLGFISPFILKGKQILQNITASKLPWDQQITPADKIEWKKWLSELNNLNEFKISRLMYPKHGQQPKTELHVFSDASTLGYGACCYIRSTGKEGQIHTKLVFSKSRVAPLKPMTMPRMELQAAVIGIRIYKLVRQELKMPIEETYFWSDSQIALGYIANECKRFHIYVANRVHEIQQQSSADQWHYVLSHDNPADLASRGATINELLSSKWLQGPGFLRRPNIKDYINKNKVNISIGEADPEVRTLKSLMTTSCSPTALADKFIKYSSWNSLLRGLCILQQVAKQKAWKYMQITVDNLQRAELLAIKSIQYTCYSDEIELLRKRKNIESSSNIRKLHPFLDINGILRVGGRLTQSDIHQQERQPAILPKRSHVSRLIARHYHERIHHLGRRSTLAAVREAGYWIVSGSAQVMSVIKSCVICARLRKPPEQQLMGNLPAERVKRTPPFTHVGMDVFGPFHVRDRRSTVKRYGLLFTCFYSRAVHIEMLDELSTDSFINALRCFVAIRGKISTLHSDNATNFIGARNLFDKELNHVNDAKLRQFLLDHRITFKLNTPNASHQGGSWERLIRSARAVLNGMSYKYKERLDSQTLRTALYEVASVLNSMPLSATDIGSPEEKIITPEHLLTMKEQTAPPPPGKFHDNALYGRERWKKAQQMADEFYRCWKSEYLTKITQRSKWTGEKQNVAVGDIVVLEDENAPRKQWDLAVVEEVHSGQDKLVRNVTLRMANRNLDSKGKPLNPPTILKRPIHKLVVLFRSK